MLLPNKERDLTTETEMGFGNTNVTNNKASVRNTTVSGYDDPQKNTEMWGGVKLSYTPAMWAQFTHK